jgi:flagellar biosynthesis protein FlhB
MSEKNLPPSEQRRRHARENGEFGLSQELAKLLKFTLFAEIVFATEPWWRSMLARDILQAIAAVAQSSRVRLDTAWAAFSGAALLMLVLAGAAAVVSLLAVLGQTNFNIAPKAFDNGIKKLNIASNLTQLLAPKKLMMAVLGPLKIAALLVPGYWHLRAELPGLAQLYRLSPQQGWEAAVGALHQLERQCLGVLVVLVALDIGLQRYMNYRRLRMDREELKRDHKQSEGDPHIKGQRKGIARQNAMEEPSARAPGATAVVVNPQHIAVALAYDAQGDGLPRIVDKGRDADADLLRALAAERRIPLIRYEGLARQLYATGRLGGFVPRHTLRAVALLYRAVQELGEGPIDGMHEIDEELGLAMLAGQAGPVASGRSGIGDHGLSAV